MPRFASVVSRLRTVRSRVGPGAPAPMPRAMVSRAGPRLRLNRGRMSVLYGRRMARGGFFKSLFKGVSKVVKTVTSIPVIGTVAKAAVGSLPIVGQVTTAVNAFKKKTPVGLAASPVGGIQQPISMAGVGPSSTLNASVYRPKRKRKRKAKATKRRKAKAKRKGGGTAKQRAARARFAKAARKGKIKKGTRLRG